jgi:hypothetical protein
LISVIGPLDDYHLFTINKLFTLAVGLKTEHRPFLEKKGNREQKRIRKQYFTEKEMEKVTGEPVPTETTRKLQKNKYGNFSKIYPSQA